MAAYCDDAKRDTIVIGCRQCGEVLAWMPNERSRSFRTVGSEVLVTGRRVGLQCPKCGRITVWHEPPRKSE